MFVRNKRLFTIAFFMALAAMIMGIVNLTASNAVILTHSLEGSIVFHFFGPTVPFCHFAALFGIPELFL